MKYRPALFWFAVLTAFATFLLIGLGGLVTSHEAGMSVPDWPTSYGYNMFALPIKFWTGGAFWEHTHRLLASVVGLLTTILAVWFFGKPARPFIRWLGFILIALSVYFFSKQNPTAPFGCLAGVTVIIFSFFWPRSEPSPKWMQWLGVAAFLLCVLQGVLGGLRVVWNMDNLGVPHGAIGQTFLVLLCAIALFTSRWWINSETEKQNPVPGGLRRHVLWVTLLIFGQLLIAATMRHQHAGLAIPDFPLAYGKLWPATTPEAIAHYNAQRIEINNVKPITAFQVNLQMIHRLVAVLILLGVLAAAFLALKKLGGRDWLTKFAWFWALLLLTQVGLGVATIWTNKAADIATLHVMVGAISLLVGALWWCVAMRRTALTEIAPAGQNKKN